MWPVLQTSLCDLLELLSQYLVHQKHKLFSENSINVSTVSPACNMVWIS